MVKCSRPRPDALKKSLFILKILFFENTGIQSSCVAVHRKDVPPPEDKIIQYGQGNEIFDPGNPLLESFAQADGPHLR